MLSTDSNAFLTDEDADCTASTTASASAELNSVGAISSNKAVACSLVTEAKTVGLETSEAAWLVSKSFANTCSTNACTSALSAVPSASNTVTSSWLLSAGLASSEGLRTLVVGFSGMVVGIGCTDVVVVTCSVVVVTSAVVVVVVD